MSQVVGEDFITGLGFIGLEPRRIYRMRRGPKVTTVMVKGNPAVLEHSVRGRFKGLTVYGKSTQVTTTGAQLLNLVDREPATICGLTWQIKNQCISVNGTATDEGKVTDFYIYGGRGVYEDADFPEGEITISVDLPKDIVMFVVKNDGTILTHIDSNKKDDSFEHILGSKYRIMFRVMKKGAIYDNVIKAMFNRGGTPLPLEPYTGGKPSPSPNYPQEIKNAKGEVVVHGKNLIPVDYSERLISYDKKNGQWKFDAMPTRANVRIVDPNKITWTLPRGLYTMTMCDEENVNTIGISDATEKEWVALASVEYTKKQSTFSINKEFAKFGIYLLPIDTAKPGRVRLQLEYSSEGTDYEPYHEPQTLTITSPTSLPGIPVFSRGNYTDETGRQWICDEVDLERGVYVQRVKKSSISDVTWRMTNADKHEFATEALHNIANKSYRYVNGLCDMYNVVVSELERFTDKSVIFGIDGYQLFVCDSNFGTIDEIQAYFVEHPLTIMYALATPIETPLSDSDIDAYKALRTYNGTTVVEAPSGAGLSVSYGCDLLAAEKEVNDKYAGLMAEMEDLNENSKTV